jgi:cytoplasmic iron level regulating protein YaaA (DUF328/UPF0246 family)
MQILLACAKTMRDHCDLQVSGLTKPLFEHEAQDFAMEMSQKPVDQLAEMYGCSAKIAAENMQRFQRFFDPSTTMPALLAYNGQAYRCLDAPSLDSDDWSFAQSHLWITSFLYGLLRPKDSVHPYRMEGRLELEAAGGQQLFDYWKQKLTDVLIESVLDDDGILVHLATKEMEKLFDWKRIKKSVRLMQPQFMVDTDGRLKAVAVYAKSCRGAMTRYLIKLRCKDPEPMKDFEYEGFAYNVAESKGDNLFFTL